MNILNQAFDTPFNTAPFSKIKNAHFIPAFKKAIEESRNQIEAITSNSEAPNFKNTIEALEFSSLRLDRITSLFFNLNASETSPEIQTIAQKVSPMLTAFSNDVALNYQLFNRIKTVYDQNDDLNLSREQRRLLEKNTRVSYETGQIYQKRTKLNFVLLTKN